MVSDHDESPSAIGLGDDRAHIGIDQ